MPLFLLLILISASCCPLFCQAEIACEAKARQSLQRVCSQLAKKHQLKLLGISTGKIAEDPEAQWGISFSSSRECSLKEARPFAASLCQALIIHMRRDQAMMTAFHTVMPAHTPIESAIAFKVTFWNKDVERPPPPLVAQIRYGEKEVSYFYAKSSCGEIEMAASEPLENLILSSQQYSDGKIGE